MKFLFPALCWLVPALGVFISCSKKPRPAGYPPHEFHAPEEDDGLATTAGLPDDILFDLEAPTWSILFDFDSYALREAHKAAAVAQYLRETGASAFLAGHASEEGTSEYNLALGAKRAVAVRNYLEAAGVSPDRLTWQSFGEERPITHDPEKRNMNRCVEILISKGSP